MGANGHPPFPATLRPPFENQVGLFAALTTAHLVFSGGFGNIFYSTPSYTTEGRKEKKRKPSFTTGVGQSEKRKPSFTPRVVEILTSSTT